MSELPKESVDTPKRGRIAQVLAMCAALAGGCGAVQNTETKAPEAEVDNKPEWTNGETIFIKDGYIYCVGKSNTSRDDYMKSAGDDAKGKVCAYLGEHVEARQRFYSSLDNGERTHFYERELSSESSCESSGGLEVDHTYVTDEFGNDLYCVLYKVPLDKIKNNTE